MLVTTTPQTLLLYGESRSAKNPQLVRYSKTPLLIFMPKVYGEGKGNYLYLQWRSIYP